MSVVVALVVVSVLASGLAALGARRWPAVDLTDPHLSSPALARLVRRSPRLASALRHRADAGTVTGSALLLVVVVATATVAAIGLVGVMVLTGTGLHRSDLPLAEWAAASGSDRATDVVRVVTLLGEVTVVGPLAVVVWFVARRFRPGGQVAAFLLTLVLGQYAVVAVAKWLIGRARPDLAQLGEATGYSFPSGHATAAAAAWAGVALLVGLGRSGGARIGLTGLAVGVAAAVAVSRVALGVHWFTDVLAGLALGWGWFACCAIAFGGRDLRFGEPVEQAARAASPPRPRPG